MRARMRILSAVSITIGAALLIAGSVAAGPPPGSPDSAAAGSAFAPLGAAPAATVANKISYQGRLTDGAGNPLTGSYNLVFQLWDDAAAGSQVGSNITRNGVAVADGLFTVDLDMPALEVNGRALWLRIQVNGQWLSPRQELLPAPYALSLRPGAQIAANNSETVLMVANQGSGTAMSAFSSQGWGLNVASADNVAVFATAGSVPSILLQGRQAIVAYAEDNGVIGWGGETGGTFEGPTGVKATGGYRGVDGRTESGDGGAAGVYGGASGLDGVGVRGTSDFGSGVEGTGEIGVKGISSVGAGVWGEGSVGVAAVGQTAEGVMASSPSTYGVTAEGPLAGVQGTSTGGDGMVGNSQTGSGVFGGSVSGDGVVGNSQTGVGVYANSGGEAAVKGEGPKGVYGRSSADSGEAVHGHGFGSHTEGVLGTSANAIGVYGISSGSEAGLAIGVRGQTNATWGLATNESLFVGDFCTGCTLAFIARNADAGPLNVGDVVSIVGIAPPLKGQQTPVLNVRRGAPADNSLLGVVQSRAAVDAVDRLAFDGDGDVAEAEPFEMPGRAPGAVAPDDYLFVVVQGLAQVRADAAAGAIAAGDPVGPATSGAAHKLDAAAPNASALGRALEPLDAGAKLIWVLILGR